MSEAAKDRTQGAIDQMKGRAEQSVGGLTGDRERQAQGAADEVKGKAENWMGDLYHQDSENFQGE
jgi:uncharacterized protein YjbJ (UPF0337 family)